jgi:hypothetical protein
MYFNVGNCTFIVLFSNVIFLVAKGSRHVGLVYAIPFIRQTIGNGRAVVFIIITTAKEQVYSIVEGTLRSLCSGMGFPFSEMVMLYN